MRQRDKIIQRMIELAGDEASPWTGVEGLYGVVLRRTWTRQTSQTYRDLDLWTQPTYQAHLFLTMTATGGVLLGVSHAPWVGRRDHDIPLWLAEAILENPELGLDSTWQLAMRDARRDARKAARSAR